VDDVYTTAKKSAEFPQMLAIPRRVWYYQDSGAQACADFHQKERGKW